MSDRDDIHDLVSTLGRHLDDRNFESLRDLFTPDAIVHTPGGQAQGHDALVAQAALRHSEPVGLQHLITNTLIDVDGDRASLRANLLVTFSDGVRDPAPFQLGEVYRMDLLRTPDGWRIHDLATSAVWSRNLPAQAGSLQPAGQ